MSAVPESSQQAFDEGRIGAFEFGIDNVNRIAFVDAMRQVRNQIVHEGGEANTLRPFDEIDLFDGELGYLDKWFSEKYPEYACGDGMGAEVSVSAKLLERNTNSAIELIGWLAGELRKRELAVAKNSTSADH